MSICLSEELNKTQWRALKKLYQSAFPSNEKKPFWLILKKKREGICEVLGLLDEENRLVGEIITLAWQDLLLVDYLAIARDVRGRGYGAQAMKLLQERYCDRRVLLEIEAPDIPCENQQERIRRKHFYQSCGMESMDYRVGLFGVEMEIMTYKRRVSFAEYHAIFTGIYGQHFSRRVTLLKKEENNAPG